MEATEVNAVEEATFAYLPDEASPAYGLKGKIVAFLPDALVTVDFGTFLLTVSYDDLEFA